MTHHSPYKKKNWIYFFTLFIFIAILIVFSLIAFSSNLDKNVSRVGYILIGLLASIGLVYSISLILYQFLSLAIARNDINNARNNPKDEKRDVNIENSGIFAEAVSDKGFENIPRQRGMAFVVPILKFLHII